MSIRYLIAAALMSGACVAHADPISATEQSQIGTVSRSSGDAAVQALYDKVTAQLGGQMNVTVKQGLDAIYVTGVNTAEALAMLGDGMSVIPTADGIKIMQGVGATATGTSGGGAQTGSTGTGTSSGTGNSTSGTTSGTTTSGTTTTTTAKTATITTMGAGTTDGIATDTTVTANGTIAGTDAGQGAATGNLLVQAADVANVPEPSTVALMLAGMLGVAGLRRRAR